MNQKMYRLSEVRLICQQVLGSPITPQTFTRWRQRMKTPPNVHQVSELEAQILVKYAELRREHGYYFKSDSGVTTQISRSLVMKELRKSLESNDWVETVRRLVFEVASQPEEFDLKPVEGRDLPLLLKQIRGKVVSTRTLYRVFERMNRKFGLNRTYSPEVVNFLVNQL